MPATTMHQRLYDSALQLDDMAQADVDTSVLSCLLGWSAPLDECRYINDDLAAIQKNTRTTLSAWRKRRFSTASLGLGGVTITSQVSGLSLDLPKL